MICQILEDFFQFDITIPNPNNAKKCPKTKKEPEIIQ